MTYPSLASNPVLLLYNVSQKDLCFLNDFTFCFIKATNEIYVIDFFDIVTVQSIDRGSLHANTYHTFQIFCVKCKLYYYFPFT